MIDMARRRFIHMDEALRARGFRVCFEHGGPASPHRAEEFSTCARSAFREYDFALRRLVVG